MSTDIPSGSQQEKRPPVHGAKETPSQAGVKQAQVPKQSVEKRTSATQAVAPEGSVKSAKLDAQALTVKVIVKPADMKVLKLEPGAKYEAQVLSSTPPIKHEATSQSRAAQSLHLMIQDREVTVKVQASTSRSDSSSKVELPQTGQKINIEISKQSPAERLSEYSSVIGKNSDKLLQPIGDTLKVLSSINAVPESTKKAIQESLQALIKHSFNQGKNQPKVLDPESVKNTPTQQKDQPTISKSATIATNLQQKVKTAIEESGVLQQYTKHEKTSVAQWQNLETKLNQLAKQIATEIYTKPQKVIQKDKLEPSRQAPQIKENQASKIDQEIQQTTKVKTIPQQEVISAEKVVQTKSELQSSQQSNKFINAVLATQLNTINAKTHTLEKDIQQELKKSIETIRAANSIQMPDVLTREGKKSAAEENNKTLINIEQSIKASALAVKHTDTRTEIKLSEAQHQQWRTLSKQIGDFSRQLHILDTPETIDKKLQSIKIALGESTTKDNIIKTDERTQDALKRVLYQSSSSSTNTLTNSSPTKSQASVVQDESTSVSLDVPSLQRIKSSVQLFNKSSDALVNLLVKEHSLAVTTTESIKQSLLVLKLASETLLSNTDMPTQKLVPKEVLDKNISLLENAQRAMENKVSSNRADTSGLSTKGESTKQWIRLTEQLTSISKQVVLPANTPSTPDVAINRLLANQIYQNLNVSKLFQLAGSANLLDEEFLHKPAISDTSSKPLASSSESLKQPRPTTDNTAESDRRQLNTESLRTSTLANDRTRPINDLEQPRRLDQNAKAADAVREAKSERVEFNSPPETVNKLRAGMYRDIEKSFSELLSKTNKHIAPPDNTEAKTHQAGPLITQKNISQLGLTQNELYQARVLSITSTPTPPMHNAPDASGTGINKAEFQAILQLVGKTVLVKMPFEPEVGQLIPVKMTEQQQLVIPNVPTNALATVLKSLGAVMPAQQDLANALNIFTHSSNEKMPLSAPAKTLITQLVASLPQVQNFSVPSSNSKTFTENHLAMAIKQAMQTSGVFSEHRQMALVDQQQGERVRAVFSRHSTQTEGAKNSTITNPTSTPAATNPSSTKAIPTDSVKAASQSLVNMSTRHVAQQAPTSSTPSPTIAEQEQLLLQDDLKVQISKLIAALKNQQDLSGGDGKLLSGIAPLSDPTIMNNPLHFPQLNVSHMARKEGNYEERNIGLILRLLAGALNRIQFHQLSSLHRSMTESTEQNTVKSIQMEIPMLGMNDRIDPFQLRIDHSLPEKKKDDKEQNMQQQWTVNLAFDLEKLGPMYVQVKLIEQTISTHIWAEQDNALRLIQSESEYFRETLRNQGIEVGDIQFQKGNPDVTKTKIEQHMVNTNV